MFLRAVAVAGLGLLVACSLERSPSHVVVVHDTQDDAGVTTRPITTADGSIGDSGPLVTALPVATADAGTSTGVDAGVSPNSSPADAPDASRVVAKDAGSPPPDASSTPETHPDTGMPMPVDPCGRPCPGDRPHCLPNGMCVACAADADCSHADSPRCDLTAFKCVQCVANLDCSDINKPECTAHHCARCTSDTACSARKATPVCNLAEDDDEGEGGGGDKEAKKLGPIGACIAAPP